MNDEEILELQKQFEETKKNYDVSQAQLVELQKNFDEMKVQNEKLASMNRELLIMNNKNLTNRGEEVEEKPIVDETEEIEKKAVEAFKPYATLSGGNKNE